MFLSGLRIITNIKSVIFEAITEKLQGIKPNNDKSYTEAYQNQKDCICAYKVVCCYDDKHKTRKFIQRRKCCVQAHGGNVI